MNKEVLLEKVRALVKQDAALAARLLVYLGEVDHRHLYAEEGYSSMFAWCTGHLKMAEGDAYRRIRVARLIRRFPAFLEPLRTGALHLTGASLLAPLLKPGSEIDPDALLAEAVGKSKRD